MEGRKLRKATLSQFIFKKLFIDNAVDLVLSGEITGTADTLAFGFEAKSLPNKTLDKYTIAIACWKNSKDIAAGETQFQRFDLLRLQRAFYFQKAR